MPMAPRILTLATVIMAFAVPAARAGNPAATANGKQVVVEAIMTLHRLGSEEWQLDIENSTPVAVTIRQIRWSAPAGMKVERIVASSGGRCRLSGGGFRCKTRLAGPSCPTCQGGDLTVHFKGTGPGRTWVHTRTGGYWEQEPLLNGHAVLIATAKRTQTSTR